MKKDVFNVIQIIKYFILWCLVILAVTDTHAGKDYNDTFVVGASGNTNNTFIYMNQAGQGRFRWLDASNKLQFSNDSGSTYIDLTDSLRNLSAGQILYGDTDGSVAQSSNFAWDNPSTRMGIGTDLTLDNNGIDIKNNKSLKLYETTANGTNKISVLAPSNLTADWSLTLPPDQGTLNYVLRSNGSGVATWVTPLSTITDRTTGRVAFGSGGTFGEDTNLVWDNTNKRLGIANAGPSYSLDVWSDASFYQNNIIANSSGITLKGTLPVKFNDLDDSASISLKAPNVVSSSYTFKLPDSVGSAETHLQNDGSGNTRWNSNFEQYPMDGDNNIQLTAAASGGDVTITLKGSNATNLSTSNRGILAFPFSFGGSVVSQITSNISLTVPGNASLGSFAGTASLPFRIYVYGVYTSSGTIKLGVSGSLFNERDAVQTVILNSSSDFLGYIYTDSAVSTNIKLIGYVDLRASTSTGYTSVGNVQNISYSKMVALLENRQNILDNGDFIISQRGAFSTPATSIADGTFLVDRWKLGKQAITLSMSRETTNLPDLQHTKKPRFSMKLLASTGATGYMLAQQTLEFPTELYGKTVTFTGYLKSNTANARLSLYDGTTFYNGASSLDSCGSDVWCYVGYTATVPSSGTLSIIWGVHPAAGGNTTISTNDYVEGTAFKLEIGDYATPFYSKPFNKELSQAKRFYEQSYAYGVFPGTNAPTGYPVFSGSTYGDGTVFMPITFSVEKRATPVVTFYRANGTINLWDYSRSGSSGTMAMSAGVTTQGGWLLAANLGANFVPATIYGQWTATSEI